MHAIRNLRSNHATGLGKDQGGHSKEEGVCQPGKLADEVHAENSFMAEIDPRFDPGQTVLPARSLPKPALNCVEVMAAGAVYQKRGSQRGALLR